MRTSFFVEQSWSEGHMPRKFVIKKSGTKPVQSHLPYKGLQTSAWVSRFHYQKESTRIVKPARSWFPSRWDVQHALIPVFKKEVWCKHCRIGRWIVRVRVFFWSEKIAIALNLYNNQEWVDRTKWPQPRLLSKRKAQRSIKSGERSPFYYNYLWLRFSQVFHNDPRPGVQKTA